MNNLLTKQEAAAKYGSLIIDVHKNGDWSYRDHGVHLMREIDGKLIELTQDVDAADVETYDDGDWGYQDWDGNWFDIKFDLSHYKYRRI
jgi:hypothetical protein